MSMSTQATTAAGPHGPGSAYPLEDGSAPDDTFRIKGNVNSGLYHGEESRGYADTKAEVWFSSEEAAEAAGFKAWDWRSRARKARQAARAAARPVPASRPAPEAPATEAPAAAEAEADTTVDADAPAAEPASASGGADAVPEGPHGPGSAHPLEDASAPHERFHVKGNADSGLYHTADSPHYGRTKAEVWFASNEHAEAAGFKHWKNHKSQ